MIGIFKKSRLLSRLIVAALTVAIAEPSAVLAGRGGGGGGGFRGGGGGGGGFRGGGGGFARAPSFSAPRANYAAPRMNYAAPRANYAAPRANYAAPRQNFNPNINAAARPNFNAAARPNINAAGINQGNNFSRANINRANTNVFNQRNVSNNVNVNRVAYNRPAYGGALGYGRGPGGYYHGGVPGYRPGWGYHSNWVNGYWGGPRYGWGGYGGYGGWGYGMGGFGWGLMGGMAMGGLLGWGLGSSLYGMGYSSYMNPYYNAGLYSQPVVVAGAGYSPTDLTSSYDYSQPISTDATPPDDAVADQAVGTLDQAREAFKAGDYPKALSLTDQALKTLPNDSAIHEFRALILFALKQYDYAAGTLYAVLSVGPGWDWTTMIRLYPNVDVYTTQLRALEAYRDANLDSASAHFVLGYHYLTQGHTDAGITELKEVARLKPQDHLASQLIAALTQPVSGAGTAAGGTPGATPDPNAVQPTDGTPEGNLPTPGDVPDAKAVAAAAATTQGGPVSKIQAPAEAAFSGNWKANPTGDVTIELAIQPDKKFLWSVTTKGQTRKFEGEYTYGGDTLTLVQTNGTAMVGKLAWQDETHFNFRIAGTTPDDPGLTFSR